MPSSGRPCGNSVLFQRAAVLRNILHRVGCFPASRSMAPLQPLQTSSVGGRSILTSWEDNFLGCPRPFRSPTLSCALSNSPPRRSARMRILAAMFCSRCPARPTRPVPANGAERSEPARGAGEKSCHFSEQLSYLSAPPGRSWLAPSPAGPAFPETALT